MRLATAIGLMLLVLIGGVVPGHSQSRIALIIGNSAYRHVPALPNPVNDGSDLAAALGRLGFSVTEIENADFNSMRVALLDFGRRARGVEMAVIFFAGHGMEIGGENWLVPVDAELKTDLDAESEAISLKTATLAVSSATKLGLVILDACRNNPFAGTMQRTSRRRAVDRGFARVEPAGNVIVAYAAKDGTTADDGAGRNSPFTTALLKNIETPGLEVTFLFRNVRDDVIEATRGEQIPFTYGSLSREQIYLTAPVKAEARLDPVAAARAKWAGWTATPRVGHSLPVVALAVAPDGRRLASASFDMTIKIWEAETGRLLRTFDGHAAPLTAIAFSPDGRRVVSASFDATIKIWDVETGQVLQALSDGHAPATSAAFSPDGRQVVSGGVDSRIKIWDVASGRMLQSFEAHGKAVLSVAFSRDYRHIVSAGGDNVVKIWDAQTHDLVQTLEGHGAPVVSFAFSPDARTIVTGSLDKSIKMWDAETGKLERTLGIHSTSVLSVAFSRDGRRIASGSLDGMIKLWDAGTFRRLQTITAHPGQPFDAAALASAAILGTASGNFAGLISEALSAIVSGNIPGAFSLAFSFDGGHLFSAGGDGSIKSFETESGRLVRTQERSLDSVQTVAVSRDGRRIASGGLDRTVKLWDATKLAHVRTLEGHSGAVSSVAFSPDGRRVAAGGFDASIGVWSAETGKLEGALEGHLYAVTAVAFSPDGRRIFSGSLDGTVRVWNADTLALVEVFGDADKLEAVMSIAVSPDGRQVVAGGFNGMRVWDTRARKLNFAIDDQATGVLSVAFSPDGRKIASTSIEDGVKLWDAGTGRPLRTFDESRRAVRAEMPNFWMGATFSPDGRYLAAGSVDRIVEVWDAETGKPVRQLKGHSSLVTATAFSPDGRWIVSAAGFDASMRLWDSETGRLLGTLQSFGQHDFAVLGADGTFAASAGGLEHLSLVRRLDSIDLPEDYKAAFMGTRTLDEIVANVR